ALHDVDVGALHRAIHAHQPVVVEIILVHHALAHRDLAEHGEAGTEVRSSLELVANVIGRNHSPGVDHGPHVGNLHLALAVYFYFHHRSHVSQEATVGGDA